MSLMAVALKDPDGLIGLGRLSMDNFWPSYLMTWSEMKMLLYCARALLGKVSAKSIKPSMNQSFIVVFDLEIKSRFPKAFNQYNRQLKFVLPWCSFFIWPGIFNVFLNYFNSKFLGHSNSALVLVSRCLLLFKIKIQF